MEVVKFVFFLKIALNSISQLPLHDTLEFLGVASVPWLADNQGFHQTA